MSSFLFQNKIWIIQTFVLEVTVESKKCINFFKSNVATKRYSQYFFCTSEKVLFSLVQTKQINQCFQNVQTWDLVMTAHDFFLLFFIFWRDELERLKEEKKKRISLWAVMWNGFDEREFYSIAKKRLYLQITFHYYTSYMNCSDCTPYPLEKIKINAERDGLWVIEKWWKTF